MKRLTDLAAVLRALPSRATIVTHSACAEPTGLLQDLATHAASASAPQLFSLMPMGSAPYAAAAISGRLEVTTFFSGKALRRPIDEGHVRTERQPLSRIPALFAPPSGRRVDLLLLRLSPPDAAGRFSLGVSVDYMRAVLDQRPLVIAEIDPLTPRTTGDTWVTPAQIDYLVDAIDGPVNVQRSEPSDVDRRIADHVATLVHDGAVIQTGIGAIPDQVALRLGHLRNLGVHSGTLTDALVPLIRSGVVTNAAKRQFAGRSVATMATGSSVLYDFLNDNPEIALHPCSLTHDRSLLSSITGLCAINSALEVDLSGAVNAEHMDGRIIAGPGGLPDFAFGAARAPNGMSIIALRATSRDAQRSNVRPRLDPSYPATAEGDAVDFIVTEFGIASIKGLRGRSRARAIALVAHPAFRDALLDAVD
ncbi:MAG: acetyl-CoA hydrolase/transferase family protein [Burkholderiales bacterium]|nr:acetyl-CoA hydrolase/transferase family protein [Burkholderiales bacterium]ODU62715.1 MAG: hypothetical protein ABT05_07150 [Lautropia sp. SCN 66-9]